MSAPESTQGSAIEQSLADSTSSREPAWQTQAAIDTWTLAAAISAPAIVAAQKATFLPGLAVEAVQYAPAVVSRLLSGSHRQESLGNGDPEAGVRALRALSDNPSQGKERKSDHASQTGSGAKSSGEHLGSAKSLGDQLRNHVENPVTGKSLTAEQQHALKHEERRLSIWPQTSTDLFISRLINESIKRGYIKEIAKRVFQQPQKDSKNGTVK